jgi:hypothetical protein
MGSLDGIAAAGRRQIGILLLGVLMTTVGFLGYVGFI